MYQPLREADDRVSGIIVVGVDVTERKKAQDALGRLAAIVDSSEDVMLRVCDFFLFAYGGWFYK